MASPTVNKSSPQSKPPSPQEGGKAKSSTVLLVQVDTQEMSALHTTLERDGFQVVAKATIKEALLCISGQEFVALICDLHLPSAVDGFTLVNAMRHFHPDAITMIMSSYPALRESVSELLPQADEVLVSPVPLQDVVKLLKTRLRDPKHRSITPREPVAAILERFAAQTIKEWILRVKESPKLTKIVLGDEARKGHLRALLVELAERLKKPRLDEGTAKPSAAARAHGQTRKDQGYTAEMLVEESRILQVCIFQTLRNNLSAVDLALVLTDVMTIADEVDSQLMQTMASFTGQPTKEKAVKPKRRRLLKAVS